MPKQCGQLMSVKVKKNHSSYFVIGVLGTPKCYLLLSENVHSTCSTLYSVQELGTSVVLVTSS